MSSSDSKSRLSLEFAEVAQGKNPEITADIEAVVVLSGESRDPAIKTKLYDTEERLAEGIRIYKEVERLGGSPTLVLNGTDSQNIFMSGKSRENGVTKMETIKNPPVPEASTKTQLEGIRNLNFKMVALVTHAYHGPRTFRCINKYLPKKSPVKLFLIGRDKINRSGIQEEIKKIIEYTSKGDIDL